MLSRLKCVALLAIVVSLPGCGRALLAYEDDSTPVVIGKGIGRGILALLSFGGSEGNLSIVKQHVEYTAFLDGYKQRLHDLTAEGLLTPAQADWMYRQQRAYLNRTLDQQRRQLAEESRSMNCSGPVGGGYANLTCR